MTSDGPPFAEICSRTSLIGALTGTKAQIFASAAIGSLVWADVISVKVPLYFLNEAALIVKEAASFIVTEATYIIPNIFDGLEHSKFSAIDAVHIVVVAAVIYLGFTFFKRTLRALKKISPVYWNLWPRFGLRPKLLLLSALAVGVFGAWQVGAFPQIGSQFSALGNQMISLLSLQNLSRVSQWLWQGFVIIYENKETVFPAVKGALAALATYATLEVVRVTADIVSPGVRLGHTVYIHTFPWLPDVTLSRIQKDWLHVAGSVTGGLFFGFSSLSFPSISVWAWGASAPGLFLFVKKRPNLLPLVSKAGRNLGRCSQKTVEFTLARPKWAGGIAGSFVVGIAAAGALFASSPFVGFAVMSGAIKAAYAGIVIALLIAAGRGWAALGAHTRQAASHLTMRASEVMQDMLRAAGKITKPVLEFGKVTLTLTSRSKAGTVKGEQIQDATPERAHDRIAPG